MCRLNVQTRLRACRGQGNTFAKNVEAHHCSAMMRLMAGKECFLLCFNQFNRRFVTADKPSDKTSAYNLSPRYR
jgi:hypothetical protein